MDGVIQQQQQQMLTAREAAAKFYNEAVQLAMTGKEQERNLAYRLFCSSVDVDNTFPEGWFQVGNANADMHLGEASVAAWRRFLEIDSTQGMAWVNYGHQLYHLGRHEEAKEATKKALEINPDDGLALCNLSIIQSAIGDLDDSLESAKRAFELRGEPVIEFALAQAYLHKRQWAQGLKHLEARFAYSKRMQHFMSYPYPKWSGQPLNGGTLFVIADQGIGDTISMMRFFKRLDNFVGASNGRVLAHVQPDLLRLCQVMFADPRNPDAYLRHTTIGPLPQPFPNADYWISTTGIPAALGLNDEEIEAAVQPFVPDLPKPAQPMWKAQGRRLHVGVAWAGSVDNEIDRWRSFPVQMLFELYAARGIQLYSLQCGPKSQELQMLGGGGVVRDLSPFIRDVVDTLSLMRDLDIVVSVESSVPHMAALVGIDCIVPYSFNGKDWRFGFDGESVLWCPKHKVVKQGRDGQWLPTFKYIANLLADRIGAI